jgi:uncharacterized protein YjcR
MPKNVQLLSLNAAAFKLYIAPSALRRWVERYNWKTEQGVWKTADGTARFDLEAFLRAARENRLCL